jgi:hypothetical protein
MPNMKNTWNNQFETFWKEFGNKTYTDIRIKNLDYGDKRVLVKKNGEEFAFTPVWERTSYLGQNIDYYMLIIPPEKLII